MRTRELAKSPIDIPFTPEALRANLERLESEWETYQNTRDRDGIFLYLSPLFELVAWWSHERKAGEYAQRALRLQRPPVLKIADPFAAIIFCTADRKKVDFKTRSKWARLLRYANFVKARGINKVAARYARHFGRNN
jgi:hypothetical protein